MEALHGFLHYIVIFLACDALSDDLLQPPLPPTPGDSHLAEFFFFFVFVVYFFVFVFLGPHPQHIEVPKEQQLLAYTTATATWVPSLISDLYNSLLQHGILNLPIKARNRT